MSVRSVYLSALVIGMAGLLASVDATAMSKRPKPVDPPASGQQASGGAAAGESESDASGAQGAPMREHRARRRAVETLRISPRGRSYIDHEVLQSDALMVYQERGTAWLAAIDPHDGTFVSRDGHDVMVDSRIASLKISKNGPEFGISREGWAIYYNKMLDGNVQIWRAIVNGDSVEREALTRDSWDRINQLPSQNPNAPAVDIIYGRGKFMQRRREGGQRSGRYMDKDRTISWINDARPGDENRMTLMVPGAAGFRWVAGTSTLLTTKSERGSDFGQIQMWDAQTGKSKVLTNDKGTKFDPYGWRAPEFDGDILVLAALGNSSVGIYRDTGGRYWERIATIGTPDKSRLKYIQSSEPFTAGGRSYISTTVKKENDKIFHGVTEAEIWVYSIHSDPRERYFLRCDDGKPGVVRHEAETFLGTEEVFLYYNKINANRSIEMHLCRTGISSHTGEPSVY